LDAFSIIAREKKRKVESFVPNDEFSKAIFSNLVIDFAPKS
jgi:hypothetical protein